MLRVLTVWSLFFCFLPCPDSACFYLASSLQYGPFGVRSNIIAPGAIGDTEGADRLAPEVSHYSVWWREDTAEVLRTDVTNLMDVPCTLPGAAFRERPKCSAPASRSSARATPMM